MFQKLYRAAFSTLEQLESRRLLSADLVADHQGIYPTDSATLNGVSYFSANDGASGPELWKSDGTEAGTKLVKDLVPGADGSTISNLTTVGDRVFFLSQTSDGTSLWGTDGTKAGTIKLAFLGNQPGIYTATAGDRLIVVVRGTGDSPGAIRASDGSKDGTHLLMQGTIGGAAVGGVYSTGARVVFANYTTVFSTDGTAAGTLTIPEPTGQGQWTLGLDSYSLFGNDVVLFDDHTQKLWRTDGTVAGTQLLKDVSFFYQVNGMANVGDKLIFYGQSRADDKYYLWSSDGTTAGTMQLAEINNVLSSFVQVKGVSYFLTYNGSAHPGLDLWRTDGTATGTQMLKLLKGQDQVQMGQAGGVLFLVTSSMDSVHHDLLWASDGTADGTNVIRDLSGPAQGNAMSFILTEANSKLAITTDSDSTHAIIVDPATLVVANGPIQGHMKLTDGILRIYGTMDDDNIRIYRSMTDSARIVVDLDGTKKTFALSDLSRIYLYAYSGDDKIALYNGNGLVVVRSRIWGGDGNDMIYGGSDRDTIYGENGNDYVNSGGNSDDVSGGNGDDNIYTGAGNDTASGDDGADRVLGGSGNDVLSGGNDGSHDHIDAGDGQNVIFGQAVYDIFFAGKPGENPNGMDEILLT